MDPFRYLMPTEIQFGAKRFGLLGEYCANLGQKPLLVTGKHSARAAGLLDRALTQMPEAVVFDHVEENPRSTTCDAAADLCRSKGCDVIVAIGGGSAMDVGKVVAGLARNAGSCGEYFGADQFSHGVLPIVAVPTTAGTGSEVTPYAVIVDTSQEKKRTIKGRALFPRIAVLDPEVTVTLPPSVTAASGLDALSQAMEGSVSKTPTALGEALALEACRLAKRWLPRAVADGGDLEARAHMLYASMLSGCVIAQSGTTLVHGMGYYFTLECGLAHGLANALLLTPLFQHNAHHLPEKVAAICAALGAPVAANPETASTQIARAIHELLSQCGISPAAKDHGVEESLLPAFAEDCASDPYRFRNQVGEITEERVLAFYQKAYEGSIV